MVSIAGRSSVRLLLTAMIAFAAASIMLLGLAASETLATQSAPNVIKEASQPDGTKFKVRQWGDEFIHGWETLDGYTVVQDAKDKTWKFAARDAKGHLKATVRVVGKANAIGNKHVRPSAAAFDEARAAKGAPPLGQPSAATAPVWSGSDTDVLFIMAEFTDIGCTFTPAQMQANLFGATATGPGNLAQFYAEISYGALSLDGRVVGNDAAGTDCVALGNTRAFYDTGGGSAAGLVAEAVAAVDGFVDFSQYDNDGDGNVDAMGIIYAGGGPHDGCDTDDGANGSGGDDLWPHSGSTGGTATADGVTVNPYIINSEVTFPVPGGAGAGGVNCTSIQSIGLFAHEFGHSLGLPDLYDTDQSTAGVGKWTTMASQYLSTNTLADTPPHFDPWSKWFLGWITPTDYTGQNVSVSLDRVEDSGKVAQFLANPGGAEIGGTGEYFLVENRQLVGFDARLRGCGVLIWHIDDAKTHNKDEGHTAATHRLVDLEQADGLNQLSLATGPAGPPPPPGNDGDAGDPYPGTTNNTLFAGTTTPTSNLYNGSPSGVRVSIVSGCQSSMLVNFGLPEADLSITKSDSPDPVIAGNILTYSITVSNAGPGNATNVVVTDTLPAGVVFLSSSAGCTNAAGTLTCNLGTLLNGASRNFSVQVRIPAGMLSAIPASTTNITNSANVESDGPDGNLINNAISISTAVIQSADLRISKVCAPTGPAGAGADASCEIYVDNLGPSDAQAVILTDALTGDGPFTVSSVTGGSCGPATPIGPTTGTSISCNLAIEPAGGRSTIRVVFSAANPATVNDVASASSSTPDPDNGNNSATGSVSFVSTADISLTKVGSPDPVLAGQTITYTLTVANDGPSVAQNVVVSDALPASVTVDSVTSAGNSCTAGVPGSQPVVCNMGNIASGASEQVTIVVTVLASTPKGTIIFNQASATTTSADPDTDNNVASDPTTVDTSADLGISKSAVGSPIAGTTIHYLYTFTNAGPSVARDVALRDLLPAGTTFVSAFNAVGGVAVGPPLPCALVAAGSNEWSCPLGDLAPSAASKQIIVNVFIQANVPQGTVLTNTASLVSSTADPVPGNNTALAPVNVIARADLSIANTTAFDTYKPSSTVIYVVTVTNLGPSDAQDVVVTFLLPDIKQAIYQIDTGGCTKAGLTLTCQMGTIANGASKSFNVHVTIRGKKGNVSTTASVASSTTDPVAANNSKTRTVLIKGGL